METKLARLSDVAHIRVVLQFEPSMRPEPPNGQGSQMLKTSSPKTYFHLLPPKPLGSRHVKVERELIKKIPKLL